MTKYKVKIVEEIHYHLDVEADDVDAASERAMLLHNEEEEPAEGEYDDPDGEFYDAHVFSILNKETCEETLIF